MLAPRVVAPSRADEVAHPAARGGDDPPVLAAPLLTVAALTLGAALQLSDGHFAPKAFPWLTVAVVVSLLALAAPLLPRLAFSASALTALLGVGCLLQLAAFLMKPPGIYLDIAWRRDYAPFFGGLVVAATLVGVGWWSPRPLRRWWFPALLLVHFLLGAWVIRQSPAPPIDVFVFQQDSAAALLRGENPYGLTFPDIYGSKPYYGPGLVTDGRLNFGFPYPPLSLFLALPGYLLTGDYRFSQLLALTLAGLFLALARPDRVGALVAALLLFSPRVFFVLEQGWTEPFAIVLLAATVACARRWPRALPLALGALLAIKQTMIFIPPLAFLLTGGLGHPREWLRLHRRAGLVALIVTLPLALGEVRGFITAVITLQLHQPQRSDALSYVAALARAGLPVPAWLAFAALVPVLGLALWRGARGASGFAIAAGALYLVFFALNKQAFCNYYFFALGALCCGIAATQPVASPVAPSRHQTRATKPGTVTRS
jgi:hypothetical protein